jgi:hypothetical protein
MIVSWWEPDPSTAVMSIAEQFGVCLTAPRAKLAPAQSNSVQNSGSRSAGVGSGRNEYRIRMRTVARTHLAHHLLTARTHAGVAQVHAQEDLGPPAGQRTRTSLVGASALHGVSGFLRKPLGLNP